MAVKKMNGFEERRGEESGRSEEEKDVSRERERRQRLLLISIRRR